jgi:hypothetical protein
MCEVNLEEEIKLRSPAQNSQLPDMRKLRMRMRMHIQDHLELCRTAHAHSTSFLSYTSCGQTQQYLVEQYIRWKQHIQSFDGTLRV